MAQALHEDLALQKNFHFHETMRIQFCADFLDLFNWHYRGGIVTNRTSPLFGQVTAVGNKYKTETSRTIQFGLRRGPSACPAIHCRRRH
jgi:hypothetical protein